MLASFRDWLSAVGVGRPGRRAARLGRPDAAGRRGDRREELARLRQALDKLRQEYGERIAAIEARLAALGAPRRRRDDRRRDSKSTRRRPPGRRRELLQGLQPRHRRDRRLHRRGRQDAGRGEPSLEMHEAELSFQAVVDPYARADFFLTLGPDEVGVEEGFVTFPALPGGLLMKVGKMRDAFGKVNALHNHTAAVGRPAAGHANLLGGEEALADCRDLACALVPNPWLFLEATGQVFRGDSAIFGAATRSGPRLRRPPARLPGPHGIHEPRPRRVDRLRPQRRGRRRLHDAPARASTRRCAIGRCAARSTSICSPARSSCGAAAAAGAGARRRRAARRLGDVHALGGYAYLEYQFARRWFAGVRYDDSERADDPRPRHGAARSSSPIWPSEFSQLRAQFRHTRFAEDRTANELLFQLLFAIGAHGAHPF